MKQNKTTTKFKTFTYNMTNKTEPAILTSNSVLAKHWNVWCVWRRALKSSKF